MLSISYYDQNKNILPKTMEEKAKYIKLKDAIVLKKVKDVGIDLPFVYASIKQGQYIILSGKDNVIKHITNNTKSSWWGILGYKLVYDFIPTGIWTTNKQEIDYNIQYHNNEINLQTAKALRAGLRNLNNELDISDKLIDTKNIVDETIQPSKVVGTFLINEYEKKEVIYSDTVGIILDLKNVKSNISGVSFDCLFRMGGGSVASLNSLITKFGIEGIELGNLYYIYEYKDDDRIEFKREGIYRNRVSGDQETEINLMNISFNLIGYCDSRFDINKRIQRDKTIRYYYAEINGKAELVEYTKNPDQFNARYGENGIRFLEGNKALQLFYNGLDDWIEKEQLPHYELVYENGIDKEKKIWTHGGEVLYNENELDYINYAPRYAINIDKEQISLHKLYSKISKYYKKPYHHLLILWFMGAWLKPEFFKRNINIPLMLCSGYTESGKTEMIKMIMSLFGYSHQDNGEKPRLLSLEGTTAFPVVRSLTDLAPVFFDELTGSVKKEVEETLRGVFNNQNIEKGNSDQSVTTYVQQAPVIIGGERMPSYQSVLNRSIYLPFSKDLRGTKQDYIDIKNDLGNKIITDEVWDIVNNVDIGSIIKKVGVELNEGRVGENYMFLKYVNEIFNYMPNNELTQAIRELKERQDKTIQGTDELFIFFNTLLANNKITKSYIMSEQDGVFKIGLYVDEEYVRTKAQYIQDIKQAAHDNTINNSNIDINLTKLMEERKPDTKWIIDTVIRFYRGVKDPVWINFLSEKVGMDEF